MWLSKFKLMSMDNTKSCKIQKMGVIEMSWVYGSLCNNDKKQLTTLNLCNTIFPIQQLQISRGKCVKEDVEVIKVYISKYHKKKN